MPVFQKDLQLITSYKLRSYRNEVFRAVIGHEKKKRIKGMFLSSIKQNAKAKNANNLCYPDTIVTQITKTLDVTEKKLMIFLNLAP